MLEMPVFNLVYCHVSRSFVGSEECACICVFHLIVCIWNYVSTLCTLNNLVNAFAALMRANKPETVSIVLILTVCSSHLYTYLYEHYNGSSATP